MPAGLLFCGFGRGGRSRDGDVVRSRGQGRRGSRGCWKQGRGNDFACFLHRARLGRFDRGRTWRRRRHRGWCLYWFWFGRLGNGCLWHWGHGRRWRLTLRLWSFPVRRRARSYGPRSLRRRRCGNKLLCLRSGSGGRAGCLLSLVEHPRHDLPNDDDRLRCGDGGFRRFHFSLALHAMDGSGFRRCGARLPSMRWLRS